ncbi:MAG: DUF5989 family protein [Nitrospira sp.]|nr:DUF5989 family protein [Nitrospira sp.]
MNDKSSESFEKIARQRSQHGILAETWAFLRDNKKWWLLPIALVLLLFGVLVLLAGTGAAPFIYTLF